MRIIWIFALILLISGCATVAPPAPPTKQIPWSNRQVSLNKVQSWSLNGKIAVQTAQDSGTATVDWSQNEHQYSISLLGPLGSGGFKLIGRPGLVTIKMTDGKTYSAINAEQLLAERWGYHLPVSNLNYWIRGLPVPGSPANAQHDAAGRVSELDQEGWKVQYPSYTHSGSVDLPSRIFLSSDALKVKIVVYQWKVA